jgi:hypothetical protein
MGDAVSFRTALEKAEQKHRPSWLYHWSVPLALLFALGLSAALGWGKLDQLFAAIFFLALEVWAISESHTFVVRVGLATCLDAIEETVDALQGEIVSLRSEVAGLRSEADDN